MQRVVFRAVTLARHLSIFNNLQGQLYLFQGMQRWARQFRELASLFAFYDFFAFYATPVQASQSSLLRMATRQNGTLPGNAQDRIKLFLCGDVMTGRGVDQIMQHPSKPNLYEGYIRDARDYVRLAERKNGAIDKPVDYPYIWVSRLHRRTC